MMQFHGIESTVFSAGMATVPAAPTAVLAAACWSEYFYLGVPWVFAACTMLAVRRHRAGSCKAQIAALIIGAVLVATVAILDRCSPSKFMPRYERTVIAYTLFSVIIVSTWIWWTVAAVGRWTQSRIRPGANRLTLRVRVAAILVFSVVLYSYLLSFVQVHWPRHIGSQTPRNLHLEYDAVGWASSDATHIAAWYIPCDGSERSAVLCHGVGADKSDMLEFVLPLHQGGYNVLAFDFRDHGESGGHTVTYGNREKYDIITGIDWLREHHPQRSERVVGVGWSMGAASLILAAAEDRRIEALYIDAAYARTFDMARVIASHSPPIIRSIGLYPATAIASLETQTNLFALAPVKHIARIAPRPIMIIHGDQDQLVPIRQGVGLFAAAGQPKSWHVISGAGHCQTLAIDSPNYECRMIDFLDTALAAENKNALNRPSEAPGP